MTSHLFALIGLLGFCLLPGSLLVSWRRRDLVESLGWASAASIAANSFVLMWLRLLGIYTPKASWTWLFLLFVGSAFLALLRWSSRLPRIEINEGADGLPRQETGAGIWRRFPWLLAPIFLVQGYKSLFLPFYSHDAISSWNRWARDYVLDPDYAPRFFYTQYMSLGQSFPYMLSGDTALEYYSHGMSFFHLLVFYAGIRALARRIEIPGELLFAALFLTLPYFTFSATGYADIGSLAFAMLCLAGYLRALSEPWKVHSALLAWLAGAWAGTSYLFKQTSLPVIVLVPLLVLVLTPWKDLKERFWLGVRIAGTMALMIVPWYVFGNHYLFGTQFRHVMTETHGDVGQLAIFERGWWTLVDNVTFWNSLAIDATVMGMLALLLLAGLRRHHLGLPLGLAGALSILIWINTANYDGRGAMAGIVLVSGVALIGLISLLARFWRSVSTTVLAQIILALVVAVVMIGEFDLAGRTPGKSPLNWRPGSQWFRVSPLSSRSEKLRLLDPVLFDLEAWKEDHPGFDGKIWSVHLLKAAADPYRPSRVHGPIDWVERQGKPQWQAGDYLLLPEQFLARRKSFTSSGDRGEESWEEWLGHYVEQGDLEVESQYLILRGYRVQRTAEDR